MKQSWYEISDAAPGVVEVLLYDEIGLWGITASDFVKELAGIKANTINLRVNSPGGDVFDGVAIYNSLKGHKATVNVVVDGLAASSASFITQAGDTVLMATGATMMIHEPNGVTLGDAGDHTKMAETLNLMGDTIASLYAGRAGGTEADWRKRMQVESWYRAQEAVDIGLADGLVQSARARNPAGIFNLSKFHNVPEWLQDKPINDVEVGAASEDEAPTEEPTFDYAEALERGVARHINKETVIPEYDFVGALETALAKEEY